MTPLKIFDGTRLRLRFGLMAFWLSTLSFVVASGGKIEGKLELPDAPPQQKKNLPPLNSTLVTLNDGQFSTYSMSPSNEFTFYNVPPGVHVLDVHSTHYHFSQIKIQVHDESTNGNGGSNGNDDANVNKCIEYFYPGATKRPIPCPPSSKSDAKTPILTLTANAQYDYFTPRQSFSPFLLLKNPMILIMLFSVGMMFIMPNMMQNLDPEQKEQMKKQMEAQQDPTKMLSQLWGEVSGTGGDGKKEVKEKKLIKRERLKRE